MNGQSGVIRLDNGIRDLWRGNNGESSHHTVGELLANLGNQQSTHTGTGTTTERVGDLEALEAVAGLGLAADDINDLIDQLGTLSVVTLSPVVTSTGLTEDEVVWAEQLAEGASTDGVHGAGLKIDENSTGNIFAARCLCLKGGGCVRGLLSFSLLHVQTELREER